MESDEVREDLLEEVTRYYLNSSDFNGISAYELADALGIEWPDLQEVLVELISDECIGVLYISETEVNTHIIRTGFEDKKTQISKLNTLDLFHTCVYPLPKHLVAIVDHSDYEGKPYLLELALGSAQLAFHSFDLSALEQYRNDPRFSYDSDDIRGTITAVDESLAESDQILLETFGFSHDEDLNRAVAVFIRYLANLSSEHQQLWKAKELAGEFVLHPDYYRNAIQGAWGERISVFDALLHELFWINQLAEAMGRPKLFRIDYGEYNEGKPRKFGFLVRPTLEEFNGFVSLLDRLLSDNINRDFFQNEVPYVNEIVRKDGKVVVEQKGTLSILDDWIRTFFRTSDWEPWDNAIKALRRVRKLRQNPAHKIDEDVFDQVYLKQQRELIIEAYDAVRTIRMMLENHPSVRMAGITVPDVLREAKIWTW